MEEKNFPENGIQSQFIITMFGMGFFTIFAFDT